MVRDSKPIRLLKSPRSLRLRAHGRNNCQLPTLLRQQCWKLLRACWQWCANGCNNSQQCWDLQCIVGRIQLISLCKPCVMSVRGPNNVRRAVQTDPTLLRYASAITERLTGFKLCATTCNRVCKRTQRVTSNNVESCWPTMLGPFARGFSVYILMAHIPWLPSQSEL